MPKDILEGNVFYIMKGSESLGVSFKETTEEGKADVEKMQFFQIKRLKTLIGKNETETKDIIQIIDISGQIMLDMA